ncbi:MAG: hydrogenase maturation nickel metallochaperone HypA [Lachnospiraceae bacterium]|nr:hydrogenase maturation nickel metallochaperone HypA [Lachnospiraceae bacterium]MDD6505281.1 hydrogenase maturation nickel metallochaperone HypA [Lachnospiraceae bacterium]
MHELGVVFHVIKMVEEVAEENDLTEVQSVTLQLGEVSTVIESYLQDVWKWAVKNRSQHMQEAKLIVEKIPAITFCEDCMQEYGTVEHGKICPHCGSEHTYLLQGNEFMIKEIEGQ